MSRTAPVVSSTRSVDVQRWVDQLESPTPETRLSALQRLHAVWPERWQHDESNGLHLEAMLKAPRLARHLQRLGAEHTALTEALFRADGIEDGALARLAARLRAHVRRYASLFTDIWYDEIGGEG